MLILARRMNERIIIGDDIEVAVLDIKGDQVKIGIRAPQNVKVYRQEVFEAIQEENRRAAQTSARELPSLAQYLTAGSSRSGEGRGTGGSVEADTASETPEPSGADAGADSEPDADARNKPDAGDDADTDGEPDTDSQRPPRS